MRSNLKTKQQTEAFFFNPLYRVKRLALALVDITSVHDSGTVFYGLITVPFCC